MTGLSAVHRALRHVGQVAQRSWPQLARRRPSSRSTGGRPAGWNGRAARRSGRAGGAAAAARPRGCSCRCPTRRRCRGSRRAGPSGRGRRRPATSPRSVRVVDVEALDLAAASRRHGHRPTPPQPRVVDLLEPDVDHVERRRRAAISSTIGTTNIGQAPRVSAPGGDRVEDDRCRGRSRPTGPEADDLRPASAEDRAERATRRSPTPMYGSRFGSSSVEDDLASRRPWSRAPDRRTGGCAG